jgi:hypothetical protein
MPLKCVSVINITCTVSMENWFLSSVQNMFIKQNSLSNYAFVPSIPKIKLTMHVIFPKWMSSFFIVWTVCSPLTSHHTTFLPTICLDSRDSLHWTVHLYLLLLVCWSQFWICFRHCWSTHQDAQIFNKTHLKSHSSAKDLAQFWMHSRKVS